MKRKHTAVLLCGHGTRDLAGAAHFRHFVRRFQERHPERRVAMGNLELADPDFRTALRELYDEGVREVEALPVLLLKAGHARSDLPKALEAALAGLDGMRVRLGNPLGVGPALLGLAERLARRSLEEAGLKPEDCDLLVVGRGTSDEEANSEVAKFARLLWERLRFVETRYAFIACTKPAFALTLRELALQGRRPLLVLPMVLFSGVLARGVQEALQECRGHSVQPLVGVPPLAVDPGCVSAFSEALLRLQADAGQPDCLLCKHRPRAQPGEELEDPHKGHSHGVAKNLFEEEMQRRAGAVLLCSAWCAEPKHHTEARS